MSQPIKIESILQPLQYQAMCVLAQRTLLDPERYIRVLAIDGLNNALDGHLKKVVKRGNQIILGIKFPGRELREFYVCDLPAEFPKGNKNLQINLYNLDSD